MRAALRIAIIGISGCGKSTLAQQLSEQYAIQYFKIDEMYWQENWTLRKSEEFCELVEAAIAGDRWVIDGHGASAKMMIWQRATHIIWLNYPFVHVFSQLLRRTIRRAWTREVIFSGNRESLRQSFFSKGSILLYLLQNFYTKRRELREYFNEYPELQAKVMELDTPVPLEFLLQKLAPKPN
jgi:adenylate kinase family enzyme